MTNVRLGSISVMFHDLNPSPPRQPQFTLGRYKLQSLCHNGSAGSHRLRYSCKAQGGGMPDRDQAWELLCEYTQSESLRKHALAVEACVRAYARKNGADVRRGAEELGIPLEEHIAFCIEAMKGAADSLGLRGAAASSA